MMMTLAAFWFGGMAVSTAGADIYAWTDENGVKHFTNYTPPKQATLFMKTPEISYNEEADKRRSEMDRLAVARQELAEREAFLQEQQLAAERRIATANARADAALQEADQILQNAQAAAEDAGTYHSSSYGYGYYYPYYFYGSRYFYKRHKKIDHYTHKRHYLKRSALTKHRSKHPLHNRNRYVKKHGSISPFSILKGRYTTHRSRTAAFRGRHGRW
jgi:hypothetical protein